MRAHEVPSPPLGTFVPVAGHRLFVDRCGTGDPAVVFLPGAGLTGLDYWPLQQRAGTGRSSVVYDRAGTGWSDRVRLPRTARAVTGELHELLGRLGIRRALLVGHSLGGLYARHYANRFPGETAGLVLLDPAHEDYDARISPRRWSSATSALTGSPQASARPADSMTCTPRSAGPARCPISPW